MSRWLVLLAWVLPCTASACFVSHENLVKGAVPDCPSPIVLRDTLWLSFSAGSGRLRVGEGDRIRERRDALIRWGGGPLCVSLPLPRKRGDLSQRRLHGLRQVLTELDVRVIDIDRNLGVKALQDDEFPLQMARCADAPKETT